MPASALENMAATVAVHEQRLDTNEARLERQDDALLRIEQKLDDLKDGWNYRLIGAMATAILGLLGLVWTFVKTTK